MEKEHQASMRDGEIDERYMKVALEEAKQAGRKGEVPVGAILVLGDRLLAQDHNRCIELNDPTAHAEMLVLRKAGEVLRNYRLSHTVMYVTVEPCPMCVSAMVHGRISRLVFGSPGAKIRSSGIKIQIAEKGWVQPYARG